MVVQVSDDSDVSSSVSSDTGVAVSKHGYSNLCIAVSIGEGKLFSVVSIQVNIQHINMCVV